MERANRKFPVVNTKLIPQPSAVLRASETNSEGFWVRNSKTVIPRVYWFLDAVELPFWNWEKIPQFGLNEPYLSSSVWIFLYTHYVKVAASSSSAVVRKSSSHTGTEFWTFDFAYPPRLKPWPHCVNASSNDDNFTDSSGENNTGNIRKLCLKKQDPQDFL